MYPKDGKKRFLRKPMFIRLTAEPAKNGPNFFPTRFLLQVDQKIRRTKIPVIFRDFVLQDEMVPKCIPRQLRYQPMILMPVATIMDESRLSSCYSNRINWLSGSGSKPERS